MFLRILVRAGLLALAASASAHAATLAVDTEADTVDVSPGDGICADAAGHCSLRAAVQEANAQDDSDTIALPAGTFTLSIAGAGEDTSATGDLDIEVALTLEGAGSDATHIDGGALDRVFDLHAGAGPHDVSFQNLTIENGMLANTGLDAGGAGVRVAPHVHAGFADVVIRDNHATQSFGGIAIDSQGCVEGSEVRILDNTDTAATGSASAVAAVRVYEDGETDIGACLMLEYCEISGNRADWAGAIEADFAPVRLEQCLISDNEARFAGAMLLNIQADTLLLNVTISGNRGDPGAILNDGGSHLTIVNSTITGNGPSSGIANVGGIQDVHGGFGLTFLTNTILYGNGPGFIADDCERADSTGGNMIGDSAHCNFDAQPSDQLDVDPGLGPLADNGGFTWTHLPGPAAIDHGLDSGCLPIDQRSVPRPIDGDGDGIARCDAGAVESVRDAIFADGFES